MENKCSGYFCNIAEKLVEKLPLRTYREDRVEDNYKEKGIERNSFKFNIVEELEVENMIRSLDISKSAGEDEISGKFLRDAAEVISSHLTYIMNLSLNNATVPDDFKLARVLPIIIRKETETMKETIARCQSYRLHQTSFEIFYTIRCIII